MLQRRDVHARGSRVMCRRRCAPVGEHRRRAAAVREAVAGVAGDATGTAEDQDQIIHTGQHYDDSMSRSFFEELEIPQPAVNLGIGSGAQGRQTGRMLEAIEASWLEARPDVVAGVRGTNSTLAGALAAAKCTSRWRTWRRDCAASIGAWPRSSTASSPITSRGCCSPRPLPRCESDDEGLKDRRNADGRRHVRRGAVQRTSGRRVARHSRGPGAAPGQFGVATIHRAENTVARS